MKKTKKKHITAAVLTVLAAVLGIWTLWQDANVSVTDVTITSARLPEEFDGFTIAHVSDLHNTLLTDKALAQLRELSPDIIAVTGDSVDCHRTDLEPTKHFFTEAAEVAPCYYVTGNHEALIPAEDYLELEQWISMEGDVLHDESVMLRRGDAEIAILGVDDPSFIVNEETMDAPERNLVSSLMSPKELQTLAGGAEFTVLLSHRPDLFENYADAGMDVVLTGHAHGGQFRLPVVGGLYAPDQGIFPEYDAGVFTDGNTSMVISRGVGNSSFPLRLGNPPEIVMITLRCT